MRELPPALAAMATYRQFIIYLIQPSKTRPGKSDKYPCDFRTGAVVSAHDPKAWTDHATAIAAAINFGDGYGVGFSFTEQDPFWFLDIDNCLIDGAWSPVAQQLCQTFAGAAVEISSSMCGLHIFGTGRPPEHGCKNHDLGLEFYHSGRFVALTGIGAIGNAAADFSHLLSAVVAQYFPPGVAEGDESGWTDEPCEEWRGPADDDELIRRALLSNSADSTFGTRASFADLWHGSVEALSKAYPDDARAYDSNRADAGLAQHLAFWTGNNCERIEALMHKSNLARDKFDRKDGQYGTYLRRTIIGAVSRQTEVLTDKALVAIEAPKASTETPRPKVTTGSTFAGTESQIELFAGCVYIRELHKVLIPGGTLLKPEQFKVHFGGYSFTLDNANEKTTKDPWEAFTQSQAFRAPRADFAAFKPDVAPAALLMRDGQVMVNTYWPVDVARKVGDPAPFLTHLQKVLPDERDRYILLCYMAAVVQHKGVKFQWAPLLQGVEGNGKTLFTRCVAEAVGRRYVHWPKASKLTNQFNSWMIGKIFYGVEDIYVPDSKADVLEEIKPMITGGDGLEIEGKGVDQISSDVCGNFLLNSNHRDAIRKTKNDRRICNLFCAQQQVEDLARDGMAGDYFQKLYGWAKDGGYAIVSELLHTFPIPDEYNPATGQRAPMTTSTAAAIAASIGSVEQEIEEAIAQGLPGFCGGWLSSIMLDKLLERVGAARRITHNKRKDMLDHLGYILHPSLSDGRVNNQVLPDGGKPRLFVHRDSAARYLQGAAEAARAYEQANNHTRTPFPVKQ